MVTNCNNDHECIFFFGFLAVNDLGANEPQGQLNYKLRREDSNLRPIIHMTSVLTTRSRPHCIMNIYLYM